MTNHLFTGSISILVLLLLASLIFLCSCINKPERTWILKGGMQRTEALWKSISLGDNFDSWCKQSHIQPDFSLPVRYPDDPLGALKEISPKGLDYLPLMADARRYLKPNQMTKEDWRHTMFEWVEHLAKKYGQYQSDSNLWHYLPELYSTLPLDGSYKMYFFHTHRTNDTYNSTPSDYFLLILVSPAGKVAGMRKWRHYSIGHRQLEKIKKLGVYF